MCFSMADADELVSKLDMIFGEIKEDETCMRVSMSAEAMVDSANGPLKSINLPGESFESNESHELTTNGKRDVRVDPCQTCGPVLKKPRTE